MGPIQSVSAMDLLNEEGPDLFTTKLAKTIMMQIIIKTNGHPSLPGHTIRNLFSPHQVLMLNYGCADTWYFATNTFKAADLNNTITHGPYTLEISTHQTNKVSDTIRCPSDTWYCVSDSFDAAGLNNTTITHGPYTLDISIYQKDKISSTLRWLTPL